MAASKRLLIVDDNNEVLNNFHEFFSSMGYDVKTADDGFNALKLLRSNSHNFNCLITDLVMPNISGIGLISIVKKEYPHLKIIAMSGFSKPCELALEVAADAVLPKPVDLFNMEKKVTTLLEVNTDINDFR